MLIQLHAQNPQKLSETMFLMQGEVGADADALEWFDQCAKKWDQMTGARPEGWIPMVCTENHESFDRAAK